MGVEHFTASRIQIKLLLLLSHSTQKPGRWWLYLHFKRYINVNNNIVRHKKNTRKSNLVLHCLSVCLCLIVDVNGGHFLFIVFFFLKGHSIYRLRKRVKHVQIGLFTPSSTLLNIMILGHVDWNQGWNGRPWKRIHVIPSIASMHVVVVVVVVGWEGGRSGRQGRK